LKVWIPSSFLRRSPFCGPTPLRYSMGLDNMFDIDLISNRFETKII
jgi:hypothetical protein